MYKKATNFLFEALKKELLHFNITIEDIKYLDGYFIVERGKDSVIHFHIKETPGWLYGIWWSPTENNNQLQYDIFAQYEEEIDKFKPSASMVHSIGSINLDSKTYTGIYEFSQNIKFIHNEPYLAFYRDMHFTNFNTEYISRAKAKAYYEKHFKQKVLEKKIAESNNKLLLAELTEMWRDVISTGNCVIYDHGSNCFPRYEVILKNIWEDDLENGSYMLFDMGFVNEKKCEKHWNKLVAKCEKRAKKADVHWFNIFSRFVTVANSKVFDKYKK